MLKISASLLAVMLLATACSTPGRAPVAKFYEQDQANLIVRYYSDDTSYVVKPATKEGAFLSILSQDGVMEVARQQPGRDLAVVILIHYRTELEDEAVKEHWNKMLTAEGYQRVVFLRSVGRVKVNGLPIVARGG